jgi:hypothetical protein
MAVVYHKSELGTFLEQLPDLVMQYQRQNAMMQFEKDTLEDKQAHDVQMQEDAREFQAEVSMYQDNKALERDARNRLEDLEMDLQKTGASLSLLNNEYVTQGAIKVLDNISEIPATDYARRAEYFSEKAEMHDDQARILKDVLYGDIFKAQQIATGGRPGMGYHGGLDPEQWDMEDIGYDAYVAEYGENPIVESYFSRIPGTLRQSLGVLAMDELSRVMTKEKAKAFRKTAGETELKEKASDASKYLGDRIYHGAIESGLNDYYTALGILKTPDDYEPDVVKDAEATKAQVKLSIGSDIAQLTGKAVDETMGIDEQVEQIESLFFTFENAHIHGTGRYEPGLKVTGEASYDYLEGIIEDAWANYQTKDSATRKELDEIAQRLFGYTGKTFTEFVDEYNMYRGDILLNEVGGEEADILDVFDIESEDWEGLFDD